jgi:ectoine hydroxylase-related dioxygenase (phytanoyl-CoA dioxygenase family)
LQRVASGKGRDALAALRASGCVVVEGALSRDWLARYLQSALRFHEFLARLDPAQITPQQPRLANMKRYHSMQSGFDFGPALMFELPMDWLPSSLVFLIRNCEIADIARRYVGSSECGFLLDACSVRVQPPDQPKRALAWHQDAYPAQIRRPQDRGVTFWVPLVDIDAGTPSLEVFPVQLDEIFKTRSDEAGYVVLADESIVGRMPHPPEALGAMRLGDVLLLDCLTLHRTSIPPGAGKIRVSADIRMRPLHGLARDYGGHILA